MTISRPGSWLGTLIYGPLLYAAGWLLTRPLALVVPSLRADQLDLGAALVALGLLLLSLPSRLRHRWGVTAPWQALGVRPTSWQQLGQAIAAGAAEALLLLGPIVALMLMSGQARWQNQLDAGLTANALALGIGVGFAEELLFRGWLWGELQTMVGPRPAQLAQAAVFALVHPWGRHGLAGLPLLLGLLLLGLLLASRRRADSGCLWGAVTLHGALVGGWFAIQQGGLAFHETAAGWLWGPGLPQPNPIGGLPGLVALAGLLLLSWGRGR